MTIINGNAHAVLIDEYMIAVQTRHMLTERIISARTFKENNEATGAKEVAISWVRSLERIMREGGHTELEIARIAQIAINKLITKTNSGGQ